MLNFRTKTRWMWASCVWWTWQAASAPTEAEQRGAALGKQVGSVSQSVPESQKLFHHHICKSLMIMFVTSPGNINQSLMTLRTCMEVLRENQMCGTSKVGVSKMCCSVLILFFCSKYSFLAKTACLIFYSLFLSSRWCLTETPKLHIYLKITLMEKEKWGWLCVLIQRLMTMRKLWWGVNRSLCFHAMCLKEM